MPRSAKVTSRGESQNRHRGAGRIPSRGAMTSLATADSLGCIRVFLDLVDGEGAHVAPLVMGPVPGDGVLERTFDRPDGAPAELGLGAARIDRQKARLVRVG